jgi:hypothetical protein
MFQVTSCYFFVEKSFTEKLTIQTRQFMEFDLQTETLSYAVATQSNKDFKYFQVGM